MRAMPKLGLFLFNQIAMATGMHLRMLYKAMQTINQVLGREAMTVRTSLSAQAVSDPSFGDIIVPSQARSNASRIGPFISLSPTWFSRNRAFGSSFRKSIPSKVKAFRNPSGDGYTIGVFFEGSGIQELRRETRVQVENQPATITVLMAEPGHHWSASAGYLPLGSWFARQSPSPRGHLGKSGMVLHAQSSESETLLSCFRGRLPVGFNDRYDDSTAGRTCCRGD